MVLFGTEGAAEAGDGRTFITYILVSVLGGAVTYVVNLALKLRDSKDAKQSAAEKTIVEHKDELIKRLDTENDEKAKEIKELRERLQVLENEKGVLQIQSTGRRRHIRYLERLLAAHKLSFEAYTDDDEDASKVHAPLPQPPKAS